MKLVLTIGAVVASTFLNAAVFAQSFTAQEARNFVATAVALKGLEERYPESKLDVQSQDPAFLAKLVDADGTMRILTHYVSKLPAGSDVRREVENAAKNNGFRTLTDFAATGDAVTMTMLAIEIEGQEMGPLMNLPESMLAQVPPQMRAQMEAGMKVMRAAEQVSAEDRNVLRPLLPEMRKAFR